MDNENTMFSGLAEQEQTTHLVELLLVNTKQKRNMAQRGYHLQVSNKDLTVMQNTLAQFGKVSPEHIANQMPGVLNMGMSPDLQVGIVNGWNTERFIFILKTKTRRSDGSVFASYVQGYTDSARANKTGAIDPNMVFYINSVINAIEHVVPGTNNIRHVPHSSFTLVYDRITNSPELKFSTDSFKLLRPIDALVELHVSEQYDPNVPITNTVGSVGITVNTSKADNRIASKQVSSVINGIVEASSTVGFTNNPADIFIGAAGLVGETPLIDVPFMRDLSYFYGRQTGEFKFSELLSMDPNVGNHVNIKWTIPDQVNLNPAALQQPGQNILLTNDPESLEVTSEEARISSIISETCSGLLSNLHLTNIMFTAQSGIISSDVIFMPMNYNSSIPIINQEAAVMEFESQFRGLVMPQITKNGMVSVDILVNIDLINESRVSVSANGNPPVVFAIPTYSNSLFDPVITTNQGLQNGLAGYKSLSSLIVQS